jgi:acetyltransferase-like isoleucine patch superfamily enzyme
MQFLKHKICEALFKLYRICPMIVRKVLLLVVTKLEGGQMFSNTLRRIFKDYHNVEIGMYSFGGCFDVKNMESNTKIGRFCSFAKGVRILNANHPLECKSTHPFFYSRGLGYVEKDSTPCYSISIGNDVWLGYGAIIAPRVQKIGDGAVIGAGSVVTKDVPDFAVVVGNPGKVIKYRFSEQTIRKLKQERWWDKDIDDLQTHLEDFVKPYEESLDINISDIGDTGPVDLQA